MARKYSKEERQEALKLAEEIGAAAAARRLGINEDTLYGWRGRQKKRQARLEQELTTVQGKKTKAIEALSKYRMEKARIESESAGNDAVDDWISAVLGEDVGEDE